MRLIAKITPYSGTVGGGLYLCGPDGRTRFMVMFCGITDGITKEETASLSEQFAHFVNNHDVAVPPRVPVRVMRQLCDALDECNRIVNEPDYSPEKFR